MVHLFALPILPTLDKDDTCSTGASEYTFYGWSQNFKQTFHQIFENGIHIWCRSIFSSKFPNAIQQFVCLIIHVFCKIYKCDIVSVLKLDFILNLPWTCSMSSWACKEYSRTWSYTVFGSWKKPCISKTVHHEDGKN